MKANMSEPDQADAQVAEIPDTRYAPGQPAEWIKAKYTGLQAKHVLALANEGIGYYILERPDHGDAWVLCALLRAKVGPLPDHVQPVQDYRLIEKLNRWRGGE
jgi:hypothetical protein